VLSRDLEVALLDIRSKRHKLIFICSNNNYFNTSDAEQILSKTSINLNLLISEKLMNIPIARYPLEVNSFVQEIIRNENKLVCFNHIDILFSPKLKINPVKLFENISKHIKVIVYWPGTYKNETLYYAKPGHPEYFRCKELEGIVLEV